MFLFQNLYPMLDTKTRNTLKDIQTHRAEPVYKVKKDRITNHGKKHRFIAALLVLFLIFLPRLQVSDFRSLVPCCLHIYLTNFFS